MLTRLKLDKNLYIYIYIYIYTIFTWVQFKIHKRVKPKEYNPNKAGFFENSFF